MNVVALCNCCCRAKATLRLEPPGQPPIPLCAGCAHAFQHETRSIFVDALRADPAKFRSLVVAVLLGYWDNHQPNYQAHANAFALLAEVDQLTIHGES